MLAEHTQPHFIPGGPVHSTHQGLRISTHIPDSSGETEARRGEVMCLWPPSRRPTDHSRPASNGTRCCPSSRHGIKPPTHQPNRSLSLSFLLLFLSPPRLASVALPDSSLPSRKPHASAQGPRVISRSLQSTFGSVLTLLGKNFFHVQPKFHAASAHFLLRRLKRISVMFQKRSNRLGRDLLFKKSMRNILNSRERKHSFIYFLSPPIVI